MTHVHGWDPDFVCYPLGDVCCIAVLWGTDGGPAGLIFSHDVPGWLQRCTGVIHTTWALGRNPGQRPVWDQAGSVSAGDLTLSPSIHCPGSFTVRDGASHVDFHGWVRDGKWVTA